MSLCFDISKQKRTKKIHVIDSYNPQSYTRPVISHSRLVNESFIAFLTPRLSESIKYLFLANLPYDNDSADREGIPRLQFHMYSMLHIDK